MKKHEQTTPFISHAVIPAAGRGTRFLPFTKAVPKELLPILNIPAIHHIAHEVQQTGINNFHIIMHPSKQALMHYFSADQDLDTFVAHDTQKKKLLADLSELMRTLNFSYIMQQEQKGLGHAVLMARSAIHDSFFAVLLPDDLLIGIEPAIKTLSLVAQTYQASVIAVQEVPKESVSSYGIIAIKERLSDNLFLVDDLIEKPTPDKAPSLYGIIGRYILSYDIFDSLETTKPGSGGEIQLTDGIKSLLSNGHPVVACILPQERFDLGTPHDWIKANLSFALQDQRLSSMIKKSMGT